VFRSRPLKSFRANTTPKRRIAAQVSTLALQLRTWTHPACGRIRSRARLKQGQKWCWRYGLRRQGSRQVAQVFWHSNLERAPVEKRLCLRHRGITGDRRLNIGITVWRPGLPRGPAAIAFPMNPTPCRMHFQVNTFASGAARQGSVTSRSRERLKCASWSTTSRLRPVERNRRCPTIFRVSGRGELQSDHPHREPAPARLPSGRVAARMVTLKQVRWR